MPAGVLPLSLVKRLADQVARDTKPEQRTTGCGGYFGKRGSAVESWHRRNVEPLADVMIFTFRHVGHSPLRCEAGRVSFVASFTATAARA